MSTTSKVLVATLLLAAQQVIANPAALEAQLRQCRAEPDSLKRLTCYDAVALPPASWGSPAPAAPPAPPPAAAAPAVSKERFGLPSAPAPAPLAAQAIESQIDGRFLGWRPGDQLKLRNGQIWEIVDDSTAAYELKDPKVRVERGRFGGFFMSIEGVSQTPRVRRTK